MRLLAKKKQKKTDFSSFDFFSSFTTKTSDAAGRSQIAHIVYKVPA